MLHHIFWPPNVTYKYLLLHYISTVREVYGSCHVVFDGYGTLSLKDHEHVRCSVKRKSMDIKFTMDMKVSVKSEDFLSNNTNKSEFIAKLTSIQPKLRATQRFAEVTENSV